MQSTTLTRADLRQSDQGPNSAEHESCPVAGVVEVPPRSCAMNGHPYSKTLSAAEGTADHERLNAGYTSRALAFQVRVENIPFSTPGTRMQAWPGRRSWLLPFAAAPIKGYTRSPPPLSGQNRHPGRPVGLAKRIAPRRQSAMTRTRPYSDLGAFNPIGYPDQGRHVMYYLRRLSGAASAQLTPGFVS